MKRLLVAYNSEFYSKNPPFQEDFAIEIDYASRASVGTSGTSAEGT